MADVLDVGQYIYDKLGWIDAWKLQKLSYYVEAWSLAWDGKPIFENDFEAWSDGPVSRKLYRENRYGTGPMGRTLPGSDTARLSERQKAVIDAVLAYYGSKTRSELIDQTHAESPWIEARGPVPEGVYCTAELSTATMRRFYTRVALVGSERPTPPSTPAPQSVGNDDALLIADLESMRWKDTLDWLATR